MNKTFSRPVKLSLASVLLLILAILSRMWLFLTTLDLGLTVDELQSTVHAYLPLPQLLQSAYTFDPHPPLYYIQLHFWMMAGNTSDFWLKLNPIFWSVLAVLSLYWVAYRIYNFKIAVFASILYALSPYAIAEAQAVRMYPMMAFLAIWVFYFTHQFICKNQSFWIGLGLLASTLSFLYSQGAGFIILSSSFSYAILLAWQNKTRRSVFLRWVILQIVIIALYLPWLIHARSLSVAHTQAPTIADIAYTFAQMLLGVKIVLFRQQQMIYVISAFLMCSILLILSILKDSRLLAISFIGLPIITTAFLSYFVKPIWLTRTLTHVIPFIYLGIAIVTVKVFSALNMDSVRKNALRVGYGLFIGFFMVISILGGLYQQYNYLPWSNLLKPVQFVKENALPSEVVYIPNERIYWGWCWYYLGPGSVNPLTTDYDNAFEGVRITSRESIPQPVERIHTYWSIYRADDGNMGDFLSDSSGYSKETQATFRNVIVDKFTAVEALNH